MIDLSGLTHVLLLVICIWLAINFDGSGGGGGHRDRVLAPIPVR